MPFPVHCFACSLENFSGQLKHNPSKRRCAISSGERRLNRLSTRGAGLAGAAGVADVDPVAPGCWDVRKVEAGGR